MADKALNRLAKPNPCLLSSERPIGQTFDMFNARIGDSPARVAVIGLEPVRWLVMPSPPGVDVYEIDPAVERIARDPDASHF